MRKFAIALLTKLVFAESPISKVLGLLKELEQKTLVQAEQEKGVYTDVVRYSELSKRI